MKKPYVLGNHYATSSAPRIKAARREGLHLRPSKKFTLIEGIYESKPVLEQMHVNESCEDMIQALGQYRAAYDPDTKVYSDKPVVEWTGLFCDSLAVFANNHKPRSNWLEPITYPQDAERYAA
jgi:hypothetical protein